MLATLLSRPKLPTAGQLAKLGHALIVLPVGDDLPKACPEGKLLAAALARKGIYSASLKNVVVIANDPNGALRAWIMVDPLAELTLWGVAGAPESAEVLAEANLLARLLTALPGNALTPGGYRERLAELADDLGWEREEFGLDRLRELGAGAFLAVACGSAEGDAALVRVSHVPPIPWPVLPWWARASALTVAATS